jgi:predicted outer membrane repeat protein
VYANSGPNTVFTMMDSSSVSGNTATTNGGGVYVAGGNTFIMRGNLSTVDGNEAKSGGGVYSNGGNVQIAGGTVYGSGPGQENNTSTDTTVGTSSGIDSAALYYSSYSSTSPVQYGTFDASDTWTSNGLLGTSGSSVLKIDTTIKVVDGVLQP